MARKQDIATNVERDRADRAMAAAAALGDVLDIIERNLRGTHYGTVHEATTDILDLIRVGRSNATECYRGPIPQFSELLQELRKLRAALDERG